MSVDVKINLGQDSSITQYALSLDIRIFKRLKEVSIWESNLDFVKQLYSLCILFVK